MSAAFGPEQRTTAFLLPVATLGASVPDNGDFITDSIDSSQWVIKRARLELERTMYRVFCVEKAV